MAARSAFRAICVGTHEFTTLPIQKAGTAHPMTEPKNDPPLVDRGPAPQSLSTIVTHLFTHVTISNLQVASSSPPVNYDCSSVLTRLVISSQVRLFIDIRTLATPRTHQCLVTTLSIILQSFTALVMVPRAAVLLFCILLQCILRMACIIFIGPQSIKSSATNPRHKDIRFIIVSPEPTRRFAVPKGIV